MKSTNHLTLFLCLLLLAWLPVTKRFLCDHLYQIVRQGCLFKSATCSQEPIEMTVMLWP